MPWKIIEADSQYCVWKEDADGNASEKLKCYDEHADALAYQRALYANTDEEMSEERSHDQWTHDLRDMQGSPITVTVELTEGTSQPVEFLRLGVFTDSSGREVEIDDDRLNAIIAGFETGAAGQDIPIDILHERKEAAGWVSHIYREGDRLLASPEWNDLGRKLVGDKVYRYLSATIDIGRNVLRSISLVNFPAIKGLRPVELQESDPLAPPSQDADYTGPTTATPAPTPTEVTPMSEETQVAVEAQEPKPNLTTPASAVLTENDIAALRKAVEAEVRATLLSELEQIERSKTRVMAELMEQVREEREVAEFAQAATSQGRSALPVKRDELQDLLTSLPKPHRTKVIALLRTITDTGTVDFTEHGTSRGSAPKRPDSELSTVLRRFVASGGSLETFFEANPDLGAKSEYDLSDIGG